MIRVYNNEILFIYIYIISLNRRSRRRLGTIGIERIEPRDIA